MKKIVLGILFIVNSLSAQYMIVGKDSIALEDFKKEHQYSLQALGVEATLQSAQEFMLLQQLAQEKKADTMSHFRDRMGRTIQRLHDQYFFPQDLVQSTLKEYIKANRLERNVLLFALEKPDNDTTNYDKVYREVISGNMTMEQAMSTHMGKDIEPVYIKPGVVNHDLYKELMNLQPGQYTALYQNKEFVTFAKLINIRPSLGYMIFGTLSYPNDEKADKKKNDIQKALDSGKKFNEVTAEFGITENEKLRGGAVMGSPTLPDIVYNELKGRTIGYTSKPILFEDNYYIFHIYDLVPYELNEKNTDFFKKEMLNTGYIQILENALVESLKKSKDFKSSTHYSFIKKSYADFLKFKNYEAELYSYQRNKKTYENLRQELSTYFKDLIGISNADWQHVLNAMEDSFVLSIYNQNFQNLPQVKKDLQSERRLLYSEYIFTYFLKNELAENPQWITEYYNAHKSKYIWDERAKSRIAIVADEKLVPTIKKAIKSKKNWEKLKERYYTQLNEKNQILVHFEEGQLPKDADIFTQYDVKFAEGIGVAKIGERTVVLAIDEIVDKTPMTQEEAKGLIMDDLTEERLQKIIQSQRTKTKIIVEPAFLADLEKNFKK